MYMGCHHPYPPLYLKGQPFYFGLGGGGGEKESTTHPPGRAFVPPSFEQTSKVVSDSKARAKSRDRD